MLVDGNQFQGFIDFEMSQLGNQLYLLGATLQWCYLDNPAQWAPIRAGYEAEQGAPLSTDTLTLIKLFAPFQRWCRFAWYWGKDEQPEWVWRDNVRQRTVDALLKILTMMEETAL